MTGEPVDSLITMLHKLVEHCDYGALKDDIIRDKRVVGLAQSTIIIRKTTTKSKSNAQTGCRPGRPERDRQKTTSGNVMQSTRGHY